MPLHNLAPELLLLILEALDRPRDLHSFISASPQCFRVYARSPTLILSSVLENAILPDALHHAIAHGHIPAAPLNSRLQQTEHLDAFLDEYFQPNSFGFPTDKATMVALCRLYSRISYFITDYSTRAADALDLEPDAEQTMGLALSSTERARFQRAFFRHELYTRVFPVDHDAQRHSLVPANVQFTRFLARMQPWEAEEMSCVHDYFTSLIGGFIDDLEYEFMEAVLTAPGVRRPPGKHRKIQTESDDAQSRADNNDMVLVEDLELGDLDIFSLESRSWLPDIISYLASLGSTFMYQLVLADKDQRKYMIRENISVWRDFLPEALDHAPGTGPETIVPDEIDDNQPSRPNLGYYLFKGGRQDIRRGMRFGSFANCPLRARAFVFWDADRILRPTVSDNLREAEHMNVHLDGYMCRSAEELLKGVRIPKAQMERIINEFGSLYERSRYPS